MKLEFLNKLQAREKLLILTAGVLLIVLVIAGSFLKLLSFRNELANEAETNQSTLQKLGHLKTQIIRMAPAQELPEKSKAFKQVNDILSRYALTPTSISEGKNKKKFELNIRLQSVPMINLLNFFYDVEYQSKLPFSITKAKVRRDISQKEVYNTSFTVQLGGK